MASVDNGLSGFLESILGQDEVLKSQGGTSTRQIHARITREVAETQKQLHATVQQQWPAFKKQLATSVALSQRIQSVTGHLDELEHDLDGGETATRPKLLARIAKHTQLARQYTSAHTFVDLLRTCQAIQASLADVSKLLDQGKLEAAVPAVQHASRLLGEAEDWKKQSDTYKTLKRRNYELQGTLQNRLDAAYRQCLTLQIEAGTPTLRLASSTTAEPVSAGQTISLQAILSSISVFEPLDKHVSRTANTILKNFVEPGLLFQDGSHFELVQADKGIELRTITSTSPHQMVSSIKLLFDHLHAIIASPPLPHDVTSLFLSFLVPPIQSLLISRLLVPSLPQTADKAALDDFQRFCGTIVTLESSHLLPYSSAEPVLRNWVSNAGQHWSSAIIERCFAQLRSEITNHEYWNKTDTISWEEEDKLEEEKEWAILTNEPVLSSPPHRHTNEITSQAVPAPAISALEELVDDEWGLDNASVKSAGTSSPAVKPAAPPDTEHTEDVMDIEEDAWGLDEEQHTQPSPKVAAPPALAPLTKAEHTTVEQSPAFSEDGWGFQEGDEHTAEVPTAAQTSAAEDQIIGSPTDPDQSWGFDEPLSPQQASNGHAAQQSPKRADSDDDWDAWSRDPAPAVESSSRPSTSTSSPRTSSPNRGQPNKKPRPVKVSKLGAVRKAEVVEPIQDTQDHRSQVVPTQAEPLQAALQFEPQISSRPAKRPPENMLVSSRSERVMDISSEILEAALAVSDPSFDAPLFSNTSIPLTHAYLNIYNLYRAIMPVAHAQLINSVPSIGMQFANDCSHIARQGSHLLRKRLPRGRWRRAESDSARKTLAALDKMGAYVIDEQINLQRVPLMDTLDETDGLKATDDPATFAQCQRLIRQVVATLVRIGQAWKPVMRKSAYLESMGVLVNAVLLRIQVDIENQEDISEEASHRLMELCNMLHDVENLFLDEDESTVALHVPVWFKFKFLSELLEASMVDIMYLWNEGHLSDFSSTELSKLIIALFADSQLRQQNLEKIARGR